MSTLNIKPQVVFQGDGMNKIFAFPFPASEKSHIKVWVYRGKTESESEILRTDYDFNQEPTQNTGGEIIFPVDGSRQEVLSPEDKICIFRESNLGNDYVFTNQSRLLPSSVEDADDALSLQILELAKNLSLSLKASVFDERTPEQRYADLQQDLQKAKDVLRYIDTEILGLPEKLAEEKEARVSQDNAIVRTIAANKEECNTKIDDVAENLAQEVADRKSEDENLVRISNLALAVTDVRVGRNQENTVTLEVDMRNTQTGRTTVSNLTLPVASETQHGVMPKEAYGALSDLGTRVSSLEGGQAKNYALNLGTGPFTQSDYQAAWEAAAGLAPGAVPPDGTKITNLDTNVDIQFFSSKGEWVERNTSVPLASNTSSGIVKGDTTVPGKVAVEEDGTMSVVGFDSLKDNVHNAQGAIASETNRAELAERAVGDRLTNHASDTTIHVTEEEKTTWNNKYSLPETGIPPESFDVETQAALSDSLRKSQGGTMTAPVVARTPGANENTSEVRNIKFTDVDPGAGSELTTGTVLLVYE